MKKIPTHDPETCTGEDTHETTYAITLSVVVTLAGLPGCHDTRALFENAAANVQAVLDGGDDGDSIIDSYEIIDVVNDEPWAALPEAVKRCDACGGALRPADRLDGPAQAGECSCWQRAR